MPSSSLLMEEQQEMIMSSPTEGEGGQGGETKLDQHTVSLHANATTTTINSTLTPLESKVRLLEPSREADYDEEEEDGEEEEDEYGRSTDSITRSLDDKIPSTTAVNPSSDESLVTKSAFEITSVSRVPPEEAEDALQGHTSKDQDELMKSLLEARNRSSNRLSTSSAESDLDYSNIAIANGGEETSSIDKLNEGGGSLTVTNNSSSPKPPDISVAVSSTASNGPAHPQSRFRRVNKYVRGRWTVRDSLEPEGDQRPESEMKMAPNNTNINRPNHDLSNTSPLIARKQQSYIDRNHDNNEINGDEFSNYVRQHSAAHPPLPPLAHSVFRDGPTESIQSLSRTGSVSSVREQDLESTNSMPLSIVTPDNQTTLNLFDRPLQRCECDDCTSSISHDKSLQDYQQGLENAMSHLQNQFLLFLQASAYRSLQEERNKLAKENENLKEQVTTLRQEIETLKSSHTYHTPHSDSLQTPLNPT